MASKNQDIGHGTEGHPRNGYAEVRILLRLQDNIPIPSGTTFHVTPNLSDATGSAHITEAPALHSARELPVAEDWRKSVCNIRLLRRKVGQGKRLVEDDVLQLCRDLWLTGAEDREPEGVVTLEATEVQFAEVVAQWSVTLDCEACIEAALSRTISTGFQAVKTLARGLTFAIGMPYDPLPGQIFRTNDVALIRDYDLKGRLHADYGMWPTAQPDPRNDLVERFATLEVQKSHYEELYFVVAARNAHLEISRFHGLIASAYQELFLNGSATASVLMCGQACEILLDLAALHIRWWDRGTPESTATLLRDPITRRIGRDFAALGGNWDPFKVPTLARWQRDVAVVRNRLAHGGRDATYDEGKAAVEAARQLHLFIVERANSGTARSRYPVLAGVLDPKLIATGTPKQREAILDYIQGPDRQAWSFKYFKALVTRFLWREYGTTIAPDPIKSEVYGTFSKSSDAIVWWLYDSDLHQVILAEEPSLDPQIREEMLSVHRAAIRPGRNHDSFLVALDSRPSAVDGAEWTDALLSLPHLEPHRI